jgi:preprotein translocase SecE subunit
MQIKKFINEVTNEMQFVKWPTRKMVLVSTLAVLVVSLLAATLLGGTDYALQHLLTQFVTL